MNFLSLNITKCLFKFQPASKTNVIPILEKARGSLPEPTKGASKSAAAKPAASKAQADSSAASGGGAASSSSSASSSGNTGKKAKPGGKQAESKVSRRRKCSYWAMYMLRFNFILGSIFIFLCFKLIRYYYLQREREVEIEPLPKDKIEPQNIV